MGPPKDIDENPPTDENPPDFRIERLYILVAQLELDAETSKGSHLAAITDKLMKLYDRIAELEGTGEDLSIDSYEGRGESRPKRKTRENPSKRRGRKQA